MDTTRLFRYTSDTAKILNGVPCIEGTREDLSSIIDYIEFTSHLQEIHQLYQIYKYDLESVRKVLANPTFININATTIALLSAGYNLVNSIEVFFKEYFLEEEYNDFKTNIIKNEYDISFIYRLFCILRNYSQHCHIPVSCFEEDVCFDLYQIKNTLHFDNKIEEEIDIIIEQVIEKTNGTPQLAFEPSICSYCCSLLLIYSSFLERVEERLIEYKKKCFDIFEGQSELFNHGIKELDGFVFYRISEETEAVHGFDTNDEPEELLRDHTLEVKADLEKENNLMKKLGRKGSPIGNIKQRKRG